jgi:hypothetical protein
LVWRIKWSCRYMWNLRNGFSDVEPAEKWFAYYYIVEITSRENQDEAADKLSSWAADLQKSFKQPTRHMKELWKSKKEMYWKLERNTYGREWGSAIRLTDAERFPLEDLSFKYWSKMFHAPLLKWWSLWCGTFKAKSYKRKYCRWKDIWNLVRQTPVSNTKFATGKLFYQKIERI